MRLLISALATLALFATGAHACSYTSAAVYAQPAQVQFAPQFAPQPCAGCQQQAPLQVQMTPSYVPQGMAAPVIQFAPAPSFAPSYAYGVQQSFSPSFAPSYGYGGVQASVFRQRSFAPSVAFAPSVGYSAGFAVAPSFQQSVVVQRRGIFGRRTVTRSATVIGP